MKKIVSLVLCFAILAVLAGCGNPLENGEEKENSIQLQDTEEHVIPNERVLIQSDSFDAGDYYAGIAADADNRLYVAAGSDIWIHAPDGQEIGKIEGFHECLRVDWVDDVVYAVDRKENGIVLSAYDDQSYQKLQEWALDIDGYVVDCTVVQDSMLLIVQNESDGHDEHLHEESTGYWVDLLDGRVEEYHYGGMLQWVAMAEDGKIYGGAGNMCTLASDRNATPTRMPDVVYYDAGCIAADGTVYVSGGRSLAFLQNESSGTQVCAILGDSILRLACGTEVLYAQMPGGHIWSIPRHTLVSTYNETIRLLLPIEPYGYLLNTIQDYMVENPGVMVECEVADPVAMKTQLLAGVDGIDVFGLYSMHAELLDYFDTGVIESLDAYASIDAVVNDPRMIPGALNCCTIEDVLACIPVDIRVPVMTVSTRNYEKAAIPKPANGWNWFDFFAMMENAVSDSDADGIDEGIPFMDQVRGGNDFWPIFMDDYLVNYYDSALRTVSFDTEIFRDLMCQWKAYCGKEWAGQMYDGVTYTWAAMALREMNIGQGITWVIGGENLTRDTFAYEYTQMPQMPMDDGTDGTCVSLGTESYMLAMYSRSKNKERASDFLAYVMSYDQKHRYDLWDDQAILYDVNGRDDYTYDKDESIPMADEEVAIFLDLGWETYRDTLPNLMPSPFSYEKKNQLAASIAEYMNENITLDELIEQLTEKAEMMLR